jgi:hypothetical protein
MIDIDDRTLFRLDDLLRELGSGPPKASVKRLLRDHGLDFDNVVEVLRYGLEVLRARGMMVPERPPEAWRPLPALDGRRGYCCPLDKGGVVEVRQLYPSRGYPAPWQARINGALLTERDGSPCWFASLPEAIDTVVTKAMPGRGR